MQGACKKLRCQQYRDKYCTEQDVSVSESRHGLQSFSGDQKNTSVDAHKRDRKEEDIFPDIIKEDPKSSPEAVVQIIHTCGRKRRSDLFYLVGKIPASAR